MMNGLLMATKGSAAPSGYPAVVLADSPLGYWKLAEASGIVLLDSSGNGYNGAYNPNALGAWTGGVLGQTGIPGDPSETAALFNSINGYAESSPISSGATNTFTLEAWINPGFSSSSGTGSAIIAWESGAARSYLRWENPSLGFYWDSQRNAYSCSPSFSANAWHHLVMTASAGTVQFYWDGTGITTTSRFVGAFDNTNGFPVYVGYGPLNGYFWDGILGQIAVYATALSSTRVAAHYAAGSA